MTVSANGDTVAARTKVSWKDQELATVLQAYNKSGFEGACKSVPHRPTEQVRAKLESLGLITLDVEDSQFITGVIGHARKSKHPGLFVRTLISALRSDTVPTPATPPAATKEPATK
jgi:hypothetical protein